MSRKDPNLDAAFDMGTRSLVTAILESRRAYQLAMALARKLLGTRAMMTAEWGDGASPVNDAGHPMLALVRHAKRPRPANRRRSARTRPFHSLPVNPSGAIHPSTGACTDEPSDTQRQLDGAQGRHPGNMGQADG